MTYYCGSQARPVNALCGECSGNPCRKMRSEHSHLTGAEALTCSDAKEAKEGCSRAMRADHWLGEILAVIHRDGGHYLAEHGIEKAARDALEEITKLKISADGAEALLWEALDKLQNPIERPDFACNLIKRISAHLSGKD